MRQHSSRNKLTAFFENPCPRRPEPSKAIINLFIPDHDAAPDGIELSRHTHFGAIRYKKLQPYKSTPFPPRIHRYFYRTQTKYEVEKNRKKNATQPSLGVLLSFRLRATTTKKQTSISMCTRYKNHTHTHSFPQGCGTTRRHKKGRICYTTIKSTTPPAPAANQTPTPMAKSANSMALPFIFVFLAPPPPLPPPPN